MTISARLKVARRAAFTRDDLDGYHVTKKFCSRPRNGSNQDDNNLKCCCCSSRSILDRRLDQSIRRQKKWYERKEDRPSGKDCGDSDSVPHRLALTLSSSIESYPMLLLLLRSFTAGGYFEYRVSEPRRSKSRPVLLWRSTILG